MRNHKTAIVGAGGGTRNSFFSGVVAGAEIDFANQVDEAITVSSLTGAVALEIADQRELALEMWAKNMTSKELFGLRSLVRTRRWADVEYLVKTSGAELNRLALLDAPTELVVGVFQIISGETEYISVRDCSLEEIDELFMRTCAVPLFTKPGHFRQQPCCDGGTAENLPWFEAKRRGANRILLVANQPAEYLPESISPIKCWAAFPSRNLQAARQALMKRAKNYRDALGEAMADPATLVVLPPFKLPAPRFTHDPEAVKQTYLIGLETGKKYAEKIHEHLEQPAEHVV